MDTKLMSDWFARTLTEEIKKWSDRAERAERAGDTVLRNKALKYKLRSEQKLLDYNQLLSSAKNREIDSGTSVVPPGCMFCLVLSKYETALAGVDTSNVDFALTPGKMLEGMKALGMRRSDFIDESEGPFEPDRFKKCCCANCFSTYLEPFQKAILEMEE